MTKLLNAEFHELFKSKYFWITSFVCAFFGAFITAGMYLYPNFNMPENSRVMLTKETILAYVPSFAAIAMPFAAAATVALILESHYSHGTVRNMLTCGHTRSEIYLSDLITTSAAALIYFVMNQLPVFLIAVFAFGFDGYSLKAVLASLSVMLVMFISTSTVVSLLLGNSFVGKKGTVLILVVQYAFNVTIVMGLEKTNNKVMELFTNVFPQSSIFDFSYIAVADGLVKKLVTSLALIVLLNMIGFLRFRKCDIK